MRLQAAILCITCLTGLPSVARALDSAVPAIDFSAEERAYIDQKRAITMCVDPDWEPFERIDENGRHEGIAADLVQRVAQRTGLKIELLPTRTWDESITASKAGRCQIMSFLNKTPARDQWLSFTDPIFLDPNIIIAREEHPYIGDIRGLSNESIALPRGTMVEEHIRRDYPNLRIILTNSEPEAVALVSERKADLTVRSLIVAAYAIRKEGLFNLKIAGQVPELSNQLRIGIISSEPLLRDILDKGVKTLTAQDREMIANRHVPITIQQGFDYGLLWKLVIATLIAALFAGYWMRKLSLLNRELERLSVTDKLTGIFNRLKIDEVLESEIQRSQRYVHPFSIILLDIDHFKRVNDTHGHQAGDRILVEIAVLLQTSSRETDIVGRWGGEEFMIICPHTDESGARSLAESLRRAIEDHDFPAIGRQSASFGIASYRTGDHPNDLVARADRALYSAKNAGRNRVAST